MNIYQINQEHLELMRLIEENEGEITPEINDALKLNEEDFENKAVSYGYLMKSINDDALIIKNEIERLGKKLSAKLKLEADLKERLVFAMQSFNVSKIDRNNLVLSFRKSKQTQISEDAIIPEKYIKIKTTESVDKTLLKKDIESGIEIQGVKIVEINNLQIK